jgi:energy-coupling factor transport system ATP-binding protein
MDMFYSLHGTRGLSTVLVTHSMEDASRYADQIVIMHNGEVYRKGTPKEIFSSPEGLLKLGLDVPEVVRFQLKMEKSLNIRFSKTCLTMDELTDEIAAAMKRGTPK